MLLLAAIRAVDFYSPITWTLGLWVIFFINRGKEKWNANTRLSQDLIIKKSTLSNTISETWDELDLTKCTSGRMV